MNQATRIFLVVLLMLLVATTAGGQADVQPEPTAGRAVQVGVAPMIDELARLIPAPTGYGEERDIENQTIPDFLRMRPIVDTRSDPLSAPFTAKRAPGALLSFEGYNNLDNQNLVGGLVAPPDINGDVGRDFYVQYVNLGWVFFNKSDGSVAGGPFVGNIFWQAAGFTGPCRTQNAGDPIVLYDHIADRWVFSQFTNPSNPDGHQCFAITQGSNPAGPYFLYDFVVSPGEFNDYPKISLWTDGAGQSAYHMMTNQFVGQTFAGVQVTAFERDAMLAGQSAQQVNFRLPNTTTPTRFGLQPAHLEGPAAPAGTCPKYIQALDIQSFGGSGPDGYQFWQFCTNWNNTNNATFTQGAYVSTAAFDAELCGFSRDCIPQPGTTQRLDTLGQFTMYRFANRFIGGQNRAVINHSVDVGGNVAGIRWAEFTINGNNNISLDDSGTLDVGDGVSRWAGSAAMDASGNIAISYTKSSSSVFPSVYFTGRETGDPAGQLQVESSCVDGTGSQLGINRWVDYSSISVDPVDDCTFWMTNEYVETTGTRNWTTRVCSFRFPSCGATGNTAPTVNITAPANGASFTTGTSVAFAGNANDAEDGVLTSSLSWTSSLDGAIGNGGSFSTASLSVGNHTITASVTDAGGLSGNDTVGITVTGGGGGGCSLDDDFESGAAGWTNSGASTCSTGAFVVGAPTLQTSGGVTTQVAGDNGGGGSALFTATNSSAGVDDVDGGVCVLLSPVVNVTEASTLDLAYFHGQRDAGDDASGDFFRIEVSTNGGATFSPVVAIGDVTSQAAWTNASAAIPAGSNVQIRVQVSDGAGPGDIVEGGIDDVSICADGGGGNTAPTVNITAPANGATFTAGTSVAFAGTGNDAEDGTLSGSLSWTSSLDGAIGTGGSFSTASLSVGNHTITASVTDSGGLSASDAIAITVTSAGGGCSLEQDFDTDATGWTNSGASTCTTGAYVRGTPTQQTNSGVVTQVAGDNTSGAGQALFTATNSSAGVDDVDGGNCILLSPVVSVTEASTLDFAYFHGQRDAGDDPGDDFFLVEVSTDGGATFSPVVSIGDVRNPAAWTNASTAIPAGSNVQIRVQTSDGAGPGDLVEGGIDDVFICAN